jgi:hypothetical protein
LPDIDDSETELQMMTEIENSWEGRVFSRLVRAVRFLHNRSNVIGGRVQALEDRVDALENTPP